MTKRFTDNEIWNKDWYLDLPIKQKLLVKFLFDNCDCAGFYEISYRTLKNCFGEEITKEDFLNLKQIIFINENTIYIQDFIKFQYGCEVNELNPNYSVHKGILKKINKYGAFETLTQPLPNPYNVTLQDKDKDKDKDIDTHTNKKENLNSFLSNDTTSLKEKENKKEKEKIYGECVNVHLTDSHYAKLLNEILSKEALNGLIDELSLNIARGKAPPYSEAQPDCHYACLKVYWRTHKQRQAQPQTQADKAKAFKEELDRLTEEYRLKEVNSG